MGVWSRAITVNPPNLKINCKIISKIIIQKLVLCNYLNDPEETNLDKLHKQCTKNTTSRIWGYFNETREDIWKQFLNNICQQNEISFVELHFYNMDYGFPYIMQLDKNRFTIYAGIQNHSFYSRNVISKNNILENYEFKNKTYNYEIMDLDSEIEVWFDEDIYKEHMKLYGFMEAFVDAKLYPNHLYLQ